MTSEVFKPPPDAEVYETSTLIIWLDEDGFLRIVCKPNAVHGPREAEENNAVFPPGRKGPVIADIRSIASVNREAREMYRAQSENTTVLALVVKSPLSRMIGNFFVGLSRLSYPVRLFTDEVEALRWLREKASG
jgi:hypothetical protein